MKDSLVESLIVVRTIAYLIVAYNLYKFCCPLSAPPAAGK